MNRWRKVARFLPVLVILSLFYLVDSHANARQKELWITKVEWSADGSLWAIAYDDYRTIEIRSVSTGQPIRNLVVDNYGDIAWSPSAHPELLAISDLQGNIWVFDALTGEIIANIQDYTDYRITAIAWNPDGTKLASGHIIGSMTGESARGTVKIWSISTIEQATALGYALSYFLIADLDNPPQLYQVRDVSWSPIGGRIVSTGPSTVTVWDAASGHPEINLESDWGIQTVWSPDGNKFITVGQSFSAKIWDSSTYQLLYEIDNAQFASNVAWSPDGRQIAFLLDDNLKIVDSNTYQTVYETERNSLVLSGLAWSPEGNQLAYGAGSTLQVVDFALPPLPLPFIDDFESDNGDWTTTTGWQRTDSGGNHYYCH
jgi:WD40 repeat protein